MKQKPKIFISTFPFCRLDKTPTKLLEEAGLDYTINPLQRKLKPQEVVDLIQNYDGLIAGTEELTDLVEATSSLKIISRVGVGLDSVPLNLCKEKGITVAYTPDAVSPAVSELAIGLMIDVFRKVTLADKDLRKGNWTRHYGLRIGTSKIGILGLGRIGKRVLNHLLGFQPKEILIHDKIDFSEYLQSYSNQNISIKQVDFETLLKESDCITMHVPKEASTNGMIGEKEINQMKKGSFLINTARGGIINEKDLYNALKEGHLAGAGIDVFEEEPYHGPLTELENIVLTQHMGSCSDDCRADMEREAAEEIVRFFRGEELKARVV
jgi:D-3-phosphoglycerate dehydrogenase